MDYLLELKLHILGARKAATDIKQIHVETNLSLELRKRSQSNSQIHHASALPPPPTWGSDILTPMSKTQRASEMACTKVSGSVQPLPTWKLGIRKENPPSLKRTTYSGGGGAVKLCHPNITTLASLPSHLTPMTSMFSSLARSKSSLLVLSVAPNLTLRRQTALESSVAIRKTNLEARKGQQIYMT